MPFQQINFAGIPPMGRPALENALSTFMKGYAASQVPAQLRRQAQAAQMANAMAQLKLQQEPQAFGADMQAKQLANAFQSMQNQEQPQKFSSDMASAAANRGLIGANTNKINTLLPYDVRRGELATNPNAKFDYMNRLLSLIAGGPNQGTSNAPNAAPAQVPFRAADNLQITPHGATNLLNNGDAQKAPPGYSADAWTQMMRKMAGFPAQTPSEKAQQQIDTYRAEHGPLQTSDQKAAQQVDIAKKKQEAKTGMITPATATQNQQAILAIKNTLPMLDELKTMAPDQTYGRFIHPIDQRNYETKRTLILDKLMASLKVPKTSEPYLKLEQALSRSLTDTDESYAARLESIKRDLLQQGDIYSNAANIIKNPFPQKKDIKSMSTEDLLKIYHGGA